MKKSHILLSGVLGLSATTAIANQQYTQEQLTRIVQEDAKQLQQYPKSKNISGERVDFALPAHMHLAYMIGSEKDRFLAEYISKKENIEHWKSDFIAQQRSKIPFETLIALSIEGVKQACSSPNLYSNIQQLQKDPSRIVFTYFCKLPQGNLAPFGEGGVMTFLKGKEYNFKFWQSWRPQSKKDFVAFNTIQVDAGTSQEINIGLSPQKYLKFMHQAFSATLCNPQAKKPCKAK